jgi:hypothetical protein
VAGSCERGISGLADDLFDSQEGLTSSRNSKSFVMFSETKSKHENKTHAKSISVMFVKLNQEGLLKN